MNNTFNINRFGLLIKRQWQEFGKIYLISLLVVAGVTVLSYFLNIPEELRGINREKILSFREPFFPMVGFVFTTIIASTYFAVLGNKPRAIIEIMVPCSKFEKFLASILLGAILPILSFTVLFSIIDYAFVHYLQSTIGSGVEIDEYAGKSFTAKFQTYFEKLSSQTIHFYYVFAFAGSSIFLLGGIYFEKYHYIKTAVSIILFGCISTYLLSKFSDILLAGMIRVNKPFVGWNDGYTIPYIISIAYLLTLIFWVIGYIRLKEKEV